MLRPKENSKVQIKWLVTPFDYSKEMENNIQAKASLKYNIPLRQIKVIPEFLMLNENGNKISLTKDIISNIQDANFQLSLFKEYLNINNITDYKFDIIENIDKEINQYINYDTYEKYKKFSLKWIKWSNFLSYGSDNFFDFSELSNLVLLHGVEPYQNQSGKTTFAIDLFHFLLFGKTSKTDVLSQVFNKHLKEETEVNVEGCITIDNCDYIIKRTLIRPSLNKRTSKSKVSQKIEYYRVLNDSTLEELVDDTESQNGETIVQTNKIIKESIGNESDFDLMVCATSSNLDDLISMKDTERGRLLSKWIGLLPIEEKEVISKKIYNETIKRTLLSNHYNRETLKQEIETLQTEIKSLTQRVNLNNQSLKNISDDIFSFEKSRDSLMSSKENVDEKILKIDIITLKKKIDNIISSGTTKRAELQKIEAEIKDLGDFEFNQEELNKFLSQKNANEIKLAELKVEYKTVCNNISSLKESEYCPTCKRKYDNIDNTQHIDKLVEKKLEIYNNAEQCSIVIKQLSEEVNKLNALQEKNNIKNKLIVKKAVLESQINSLTVDYKEQNSLQKEFIKNSEAIEKNNKLDLSIRNIEANLKEKRNQYQYLTIEINNDNNKIINNEQKINEKDAIIKKIDEELILDKHWKIYLDMIGKNGISKMVLRKSLPIINANLTSLLSNVCDFNVQLEINEKNDIGFFLIKNGVKSMLSSGSGFELTCASLALRSVLTKISSMPKPNFLILDEVLGRVAQSNYDNMKLLYDKILEDYDFIIQVTHIESVKDWHDYIISVSKEDNISKIMLSKNKK